MKNILYSLIAIGLFLLPACNTGKKHENQTPQVFKIDLNKENDPQTLERFLEAMEIRFLPFELTDSSLFDGSSSRMIMTDNYIFIEDGMQSCILRFDKQGNYLNKINRLGQGSEEYNTFLDVSVGNGLIYVADWTKIQVYDYEGKYIKTIPFDINNGRIQVYADADGKVYIRRSYKNPTQLQVFNQNNELLAEYFPTPAVLRQFTISKGNTHSLGSYDDGIYVANSMDNTVYLLKDTVTVLAKFDFGSMNMPSDFFDGTSEQVEQKFWNLRGTPEKGTQGIVFINRLVVTDNWITFIPESLDPVVVFCNRKENTCITNKGIKAPYDIFLGGYNAPEGYDADTDEFYCFVSAMKLKETIEVLVEEGDDYLTKYPFLKHIDIEKIDENSNDLAVFYKIK